MFLAIESIAAFMLVDGRIYEISSTLALVVDGVVPAGYFLLGLISASAWSAVLLPVPVAVAGLVEENPGSTEHPLLAGWVVILALLVIAWWLGVQWGMARNRRTLRDGTSR